MMAKIRVLVVEDSFTVRKRLVEVLNAQPDLEVIGEAEDGKRGIEMCERLRPDVVTLDMMLPVMSGLAATEYIMAYCPTPILIVSASTNRGELFKTYEALAAGAVDVLEKPRGDEPDEEWERKLVLTLKIVSRVKVITHLRLRLGSMGRAPVHSLSVEPSERSKSPRLIAIGASTGGPGAVLEILRSLPPRFALPILLVIHIGEPFGTAFADWLDGQSPMRVSYAVEGEVLPMGQGRMIMAPPNHHLVFQHGRLHLDKGPERHSCRPSVDVLFESLARELGDGIAACLLTGMGKDGAEGLLAIRRAGGTTIAQDEATSIVFGMPREAILLGAAMRVLPLERIGPALVALARMANEEGGAQ
jgi:two-component system chemotaxis response regulator CheB